jgi:hypothetical protein
MNSRIFAAFAFACAFAGSLALSFGIAKANTFDVTGTYSFPSSGTFSGTLNIDTVAGTITSGNILFSGVADFTNLVGSAPCCPGFNNQNWDVLLHDNVGDELLLEFTTPLVGPPASLVGFTGGVVLFGRHLLYAVQTVSKG